MQLVCGLDGQLLWTKISLSKFCVCKWHLWNAVNIRTMEKIHLVLIWLVGISKICCTIRAMAEAYVLFCATKIKHICNFLDQWGINFLDQFFKTLNPKIQQVPLNPCCFVCFQLRKACSNKVQFKKKEWYKMKLQRKKPKT
jgi:hypothetical protein